MCIDLKKQSIDLKRAIRNIINDYCVEINQYRQEMRTLNSYLVNNTSFPVYNENNLIGHLFIKFVDYINQNKEKYNYFGNYPESLPSFTCHTNFNLRPDMFEFEYEQSLDWNMSYAEYWKSNIILIQKDIQLKYNLPNKKNGDIPDLCDLDLFFSELGSECPHEFPFPLGFEVKIGKNIQKNLDREYNTLKLFKEKGLIREIGVIYCYKKNENALEFAKKVVSSEDLFLIELD